MWRSNRPLRRSRSLRPDAQVHTGTSSGLTGDTRIQNLLADHQYFRVQSQLDELPPEQAQLYRGILANRNNDPKESIKLLEPLVDKIASSGDAVHEKLARKALAEDYLRDGDFSKAAKEYQSLHARLESTLTPDEKDEIEMPLKLLPLAASNPPMTVDPCDAFVLQVSRNPLGLTDIPVFVDARPHTWMLDPTAPFNLIARSLAREVGLKVSEEAATIHTLTGRAMQVHSTVIPRFTLGGRLTFHDMTAFVFEDADYNFAQSKYQVQGVLGYPALSALSSLTVTDNATIELHPRRPAADAATVGAELRRRALLSRWRPDHRGPGTGAQRADVRSGCGGPADLLLFPLLRRTCAAIRRIEAGAVHDSECKGDSAATGLYGRDRSRCDSARPK